MLVLLLAVLSGVPSCIAQCALGTIVPFYVNPGDGAWSQLVAAKAAVPAAHVIAIINPDSGPGSSKDPGYSSGYVATTYGKKPTSEAFAEIDKYAEWYPQLQGIFFDEMSEDASDAGFYTQLRDHVFSKGWDITVGNPGVVVPDSLASVLNTTLIYETNGLPSTPFPATTLPRNKFGIMYGSHQSMSTPITAQHVLGWSLHGAVVASAQPSHCVCPAHIPFLRWTRVPWRTSTRCEPD